ncbi:MAG: MipA/OmpV family protein [Sulfitobacter sp.]
MRLVLCLAVALGAALPAAAQERSFSFALRGGLSTGPSYPGADSYEVGPDLGFGFGALKWGNKNIGTHIGEIPQNGVSVRGALRTIGERSASDHAELAGLEDIDAAVELGLGVEWRDTNVLVFGEIRQGFGGHDGVTGEIGADLILRPSDRWTLTAGPRLSLGSNDYASTYFGVTAAEAAASNFAAYDAEGGVLGAGFEIGATYRFSDLWAMESALTYEKLLNDAGDSPITAAGSDDQLSFRIGLSRTFNLRF